MDSKNKLNRRNFLKTFGAGTTSLAAFGTGGALFTKLSNSSIPVNRPAGDSALTTTSIQNPDLGTMYQKVSELVEDNPFSYSFLNNRFKNLEEFKAAGRNQIFDLYGYNPDPVSPDPELLERLEFDDYIREKVLFSTSKYFRVPAYVHIPKNLTGRAPAIIDLHSHGGMFLYGKEKVIDFEPNDPVMNDYHQINYEGRPTTTELVRRGYVVITIDAFMFGERRLMMNEDLSYGWDRSSYSPEDAQYLNGQCRSKANTLVKSLIYAGKTWPGIVAWDDIRTVDYLLTRPEVDPDRIGCIGVSFGGWRTLFLAGLDERISAACIAGFMSTVEPMIRNHIDTHSWVHFVPGLHRYLDLPDVAGMMAPKPLMVLQCSQDGLFPIEGMKNSVNKLSAIYEKAGHSEQFYSRFYEQPHIFNIEMQNDAFDWLDQKLA